MLAHSRFEIKPLPQSTRLDGNDSNFELLPSLSLLSSLFEHHTKSGAPVRANVLVRLVHIVTPDSVSGSVTATNSETVLFVTDSSLLNAVSGVRTVRIACQYVPCCCWCVACADLCLCRPFVLQRLFRVFPETLKPGIHLLLTDLLLFRRRIIPPSSAPDASAPDVSNASVHEFVIDHFTDISAIADAAGLSVSSREWRRFLRFVLLLL